MWFTPESRFRILIVRRPVNGDIAAARVFDAERHPSSEEFEEEIGAETVRLAQQFGTGFEILEATAGGPRPLLGEWWRGHPRLRFLVVRRKAGKKEMPVRKFLDAGKYRSEEQFDKAVSEEKDRLLDKYSPLEWDVMEIEAASMDDFKSKFPDLAR